MNRLEQELDILAVEILSEQNKMSDLEILKEKTTRGERIDVGFNIIKFNQLVYSFMRFYKIADVTKLSDNTKELVLTLIDEVEQAKKLLKTEELPKEMQEFLNA